MCSTGSRIEAIKLIQRSIFVWNRHLHRSPRYLQCVVSAMSLPELCLGYRGSDSTSVASSLRPTCIYLLAWEHSIRKQAASIRRIQHPLGLAGCVPQLHTLSMASNYLIVKVGLLSSHRSYITYGRRSWSSSTRETMNVSRAHSVYQPREGHTQNREARAPIQVHSLTCEGTYLTMSIANFTPIAIRSTMIIFNTSTLGMYRSLWLSRRRHVLSYPFPGAPT